LALYTEKKLVSLENLPMTSSPQDSANSHADNQSSIRRSTNSLQKLVSLENFPTTSSQQDSAGPHADTVTRDAVFSSTPAFFFGNQVQATKTKVFMNAASSLETCIKIIRQPAKPKKTKKTSQPSVPFPPDESQESQSADFSINNEIQVTPLQQQQQQQQHSMAEKKWLENLLSRSNLSRLNLVSRKTTIRTVILDELCKTVLYSLTVFL
jgi:hypothetical protein